MPVNPYDDRKVSLRRPHGYGDLDMVRASYTRRKANVTEVLIRTSVVIDVFVQLAFVGIRKFCPNTPLVRR